MKKMKLILMILMISGIGFTAYASPADEAEAALSRLTSKIGEFDFYGFARELSLGKNPGFMGNIKELLMGELSVYSRILAVSFLPVLLYGILRFVGTGKKNSASEGAFIVCFGVVMTSVTGVFKGMTELVYDTAATVDIVNKSLIPVLFSLLVSSGGITQATLSQPVVFAVSQLLTHFMFRLLIPAVTVGYALTVTDCVTGVGGLKYMGEMLLSLTKKLLVFSMVIFMGVLSVQKLMGNAVDSVVLRGTKFAVSNLIPVVGGAVSEGVEALGASVRVIRNSTGIAGIAGIIVLIVPPLIKIYSCALVMHFFAAISFPVSDKRFGEMLSFSGQVMSILGSVILCMAFVFIITAGTVAGSQVI